MTSNELLVCVSSVVFFSFLFNEHQTLALVRLGRAAKGIREREARTHRHIEGPLHDVGLFLIKVTQATNGGSFHSLHHFSKYVYYDLNYSIPFSFNILDAYFTSNQNNLLSKKRKKNEKVLSSPIIN